VLATIFHFYYCFVSFSDIWVNFRWKMNKNFRFIWQLDSTLFLIFVCKTLLSFFCDSKTTKKKLFSALIFLATQQSQARRRFKTMIHPNESQMEQKNRKLSISECSILIKFYFPSAVPPHSRDMIHVPHKNKKKRIEHRRRLGR
jgi:hypothetical protein